MKKCTKKTGLPKKRWDRGALQLKTVGAPTRRRKEKTNK